MADNSDIIVDGWSARYVRAFAQLLDEEGGFVDHKADRGGATKYGISLRFLKAAGATDEDRDGWADFDLDFDGDIDGLDVRKLRVADAKFLYHRHFWQAAKCESLPEPIGEMLFDQAVNGGIVAAVKMLQRACNLPSREQIEVDGKLGPKTMTRVGELIGSHGVQWMVASYRASIKHRYQQIVARMPSQQVFLRGWLARADRLGRPATT